MPITQPRLLRLLEAAEHYQFRYREFYHSIYSRCKDIAQRRSTVEDAFREITDELTLMGQYSVHDTIISEERTRYQLTHSRNATERLRQMQKRQQSPGHQGLPLPMRRHPRYEPLTTGPALPDPAHARAVALANMGDEAFEGLSDLGDDPFTTSHSLAPLPPDDFDEPAPGDVAAAVARTLAKGTPLQPPATNPQTPAASEDTSQ